MNKLMNKSKLTFFVLITMLSALIQADESIETRFAEAQLLSQQGSMIEAMQSFEVLANEQYGPAQTEYAYLLHKAGYYDQSWHWYVQADKNGDGAGAFGLASMIMSDEVPENRSVEEIAMVGTALEILLRSADRGYWASFRSLFYYYSNGYKNQPVAVDQALYYLEGGANAGDPWSQFHLGETLEQGLYAHPIEVSKAIVWYRKSATAGNTPAILQLVKLHEQELYGLKNDAKLIQALKEQIPTANEKL